MPLFETTPAIDTHGNVDNSGGGVVTGFDVSNNCIGCSLNSDIEQVHKKKNPFILR
jgi:hypothetical protein